MKNICIIGIGGVGGYFGGKLAYYLLSTDQLYHVTFIARGKHLEAIKKNGLLFKTPDGEFICKPSLVTNNLAEIPVPDLVLICTKSYDLDTVAKELAKVVSSKTLIIPLLNGVDIVERLEKHIQLGIILPACVYIATYISNPGEITLTGAEGFIVAGKPGFQPDSLLSLMNEAHIKIKWTETPFNAIWEKYLLVSSFALVTAYYNKTFIEVINDPEAKTDVIAVMNEIKALAKSQSIILSDDIIEKTIHKVSKLSANTKTSYQRDIEIKGNVNEGDIFGQTIIDLGNKSGIDVSVSTRLFNSINHKLAHQII
jgi:2-dehydropantoate 2-reductase